MGQAVAEKGHAPLHEKDADEGADRSEQQAGDQGPLQEAEGERLPPGAHAPWLPRPATSRGSTVAGGPQARSRRSSQSTRSARLAATVRSWVTIRMLRA